MRRLLCATLFLVAASLGAQYTDFAYHITSAANHLDGLPVTGSGVSPYLGTPVLGDIIYFDGTNWVSLAKGTNGQVLTEQASGIPFWTGSAGGAPSTATYITQTADAGLSAEQALGALATGFMKSTTGTGVVSTQATITLPDLATQAAKTFVMNNATSTAAPTAVTAADAMETLVMDTGTIWYRSDFCGFPTEFTGNNVSGGTFNTGLIDLAADRYCGMAAAISTTAGSIAEATYSASNAQRVIQLGRGVFHFKIMFNIPVASDGTDTWRLTLGLCSTVGTGVCNSGVGFYYLSSTSANWLIFAADNGTSTTTTTSTAVTVGAASSNANWTTVEFTVNAAGTSVDYLINGATPTGSPISTNIPINNARQTAVTIKMERTAGTTNARQVNFDFMAWMYRLTTAR